MTVYVDNPAIQYGRMKMAHLWADSLEELLAMADKIGVRRKWLQQPPKASWVHFDVCLAKRRLALANGAVETDRYGPAEHVAKMHGKADMLELIAKARARHRKSDPPPVPGLTLNRSVQEGIVPGQSARGSEASTEPMPAETEMRV